MYGNGSVVKRGLLNLPCRPCARVAVIEDNKPQRTPCGNEVAVGLLVNDRGYITKVIDREAVTAILDGA